MSESQPAPTPPPPSAPTALAIPPGVPPAAVKALRTGDNLGLLAALGIDVKTIPAELVPRVRQLAEVALEIRRQSVATLGDHEAFVRHTDKGSLHQVIRPVRLSLADKTLYQIPIRRPFKRGTDEEAPRDWDDTEWREIAQTKADITHYGLLKINAVVGCAVALPPSVMVDGEARTNPYVERFQTANGRLGDIVRVIVGVTVVGPAPMTGNPCVCNYVLDYDPAKDLQHKIAEIAEKLAKYSKAGADLDVYLIDEEEWGAKPKPGWKFIPVFGGVGYAVNLRHKQVAEAYQEHINMLQNSTKKAQTVARRNAMKAHPALAFHTVEVDTQGRALIAAIGWAGDESSMRQWMAIQERLATGLKLPEATQIIDIGVEKYDPIKDAPASVEHGGEGKPAAKEHTQANIDPELEARNKLIEQIDYGIGLLTPSQIEGLGYEPKTATVDQLREILTRINGYVDASGAGQ